MHDGRALTERFDEAYILASELHREQKRKGNNTPYLAHLLAVASIVLDSGGDEDAAIAGLLHDAVEDQGGLATLERIRAAFGDRVASLVMECSDNEGEPKRPWLERKQDFIALIPQLSPDARLIAIADKLHNARTLLTEYLRQGEEVWNRFNGQREGTLWYYRSAYEAFAASGNEPVLYELKHAVNEMLKMAGEESV